MNLIISILFTFFFFESESFQGSSKPKTQNLYFPDVSVTLFDDQEWAGSADYNNDLSLDNQIGENDGLLTYLPWYVELHIMPQSKQLIERATRRHIYSDMRGDISVNATEVLEVIDREYKCSDAPIILGDEQLHIENKTICQKVSRILSFAAYHRLPKEITAQLLGGDTSLSDYQESFSKLRDWNDVVFPRGLAIRPPRSLLNSPIHRFNPIPRRFLLSRNIRMAKQATAEAARVRAPPTVMAKEAFLASLSREMTVKPKVNMLNEVFPFFPTRRSIRKFILHHLSKMKSLLNLCLKFARVSATPCRAILLSYFMVTFPLYSTSLIWHWQKLSATFCVGSSVIMSSLIRISGILAKVYSTGLKNSYLLWTLLLAPFAHIIIKNSAHRSQVKDDTKAMVKISTLLALSHIVVGAIVFLLDAAMVSVFHNEMMHVLNT